MGITRGICGNKPFVISYLVDNAMAARIWFALPTVTRVVDLFTVGFGIYQSYPLSLFVALFSVLLITSMHRVFKQSLMDPVGFIEQ